ncbi:MAG: YceI family protein [Chitinophagaceae bacterium]|nr:YceI family protein [Chitinophagaceae bacterium]
MKMKKVILFTGTAILVIAGAAFTMQKIINWKIDSSTAQVKFSLSAHEQETKGSFKNVKGEIEFNKNDLAASFLNCTIDVTTISTEIENRDQHLRSADFFNADKFPVITFKSKKIEQTTTGYTAVGDLTIKEITKEVSVPFTFDDAKKNGDFKGMFTINRSAFGVGEPGNDIGDVITLWVDMPVEKL